MAKNFIAGAIKHKGALRETAKRDGLIKGGEKLSKTDVSKLEKSRNPTTKKRAELAATLEKMRKSK